LLDDFLSVDAAVIEVDGVRQRRLSLERGDAAAALVRRVDDDMILLTRQFRYPTYAKGPGWVIETAAGVVENGEDPAETMRRELVEELGYHPSHLEPIATFYASPGGSSERLHLFYAEVSEADRIGTGGGLDSEHEDIEIVALSFAELRARLEAGELVDAKTIIAAQWLTARRSATET
jgi:ADP-ribose pyrophosphatase